MPQGAPADVVQPGPNGVLQLLVTQKDRCGQGQPEVLSGIMGILTPWHGGREETALADISRRGWEVVLGTLRTLDFVCPTSFPTPFSWFLGGTPLAHSAAVL